MNKILSLVLVIAASLVITATVSITLAQLVNAQTPTAATNNQVPSCIAGNTDINSHLCLSNCTNTEYCNANQYCQTQQGCYGYGYGCGVNGQNQLGYGCGLGIQRGCGR